MTFTEELKTKSKMYERLQKHSEEDTFLVLTQEQWTVVRKRWTSVTQKTRIWQWKLYSNMPGHLGYIGDWLYRAEEMVESEIPYVEKHEDTAANIKVKLDELKVK
jgi:nesprin-1